MRRERIARKPVRKQRRHPEVLPLDPRDPAVLRAKGLLEASRPPRRRAA